MYFCERTWTAKTAHWQQRQLEVVYNVTLNERKPVRYRVHGIEYEALHSLRLLPTLTADEFYNMRQQKQAALPGFPVAVAR